MKRDKLDIVFSNLVRERPGWVCERCETYYPEGRRGGLECSHVFGRGRHSVRWDERNAFALCTGCHRFFTAHPAEHHLFALDRMGEDAFSQLRLDSNSLKRRTKNQKEKLYQRLKAALTDMKERRAMGHQGRLEFHLEAA